MKAGNHKFNITVNQSLVLICLVMFLVGFLGCRTPHFEPVDITKIPDGEYEGRAFKFPGRMIVHTIIKDGKISEIKIIKHLALKKYTNMMQPLIDSIIAKQDVRVDAVTGATISSIALKSAVYDSLKKAEQQSMKSVQRTDTGNK